MSKFIVVKKGSLYEHNSQTSAEQAASQCSYRQDEIFHVVQVVSTTSPFPRNHGKDWSHADDTTLLIKYMSGNSSPEELAPQYERTTWAIQCRLRALGLGKVEAYTNYRGW